MSTENQPFRRGSQLKRLYRRVTRTWTAISDDAHLNARHGPTTEAVHVHGINV